MKTKDYIFLRNADDFQVISKKAFNLVEKLPPNNYVVRVDPQTGQFYLQMVESFTHPTKMYGHNMQWAQRIKNTFLDRPFATGAIFSGEKGSGKTLLARTISIEAARENEIPTIIINQNHAGDKFYAFLASITQPCIILFDEFEKVYDARKNEQDAILTLLDGTFPSKKLFILTCNDRFGINTNMMNRPGRLFYAMEFHGLEKAFIEEYLADNLVNKKYIPNVLRMISLFSDFNFDMLKALIEEMNRYNETASEALNMLNVSPANDYMYYKATILLADGAEQLPGHLSPNQIKSPLGMKSGMSFRAYVVVKKGKDGKKDENEHRTVVFFPGEAISTDEHGFVFRNKNGDLLKLVREKVGNYNWTDVADKVVDDPTAKISPSDVAMANAIAAEEATENQGDDDY